MKSRSTNTPQPSAASAVITADSTAVRARRLSLELSRVARKAREACSETESELAADIGTQQQQISHHENPNQPHTPTYRQMHVGPTEYRRVYVRELAALDGDTVQRALAVLHGDNHMRRISALAHESGDAITTITSALADDVLTDAELEAWERECLEASDAFLESAACARELLSQRRAKR